jgi:hypothetical protein
LGVEIDGQSRAYPINMITRPQREVVNDQLAGHAIAATWCQLCFNGIVYSRKVRGRTLTFHVYGMWNDGMVFRDVETETIWSQLLGEAIRGSLRGTELVSLPSVVTQWKTWRNRYPGTTVVVLPRLDNRYTRDAYDDLGKFVLGVSIDSKQRHYPFTELTESPVVNDRFAGRELLVVFGTKSCTAVCFAATLDGKRLTFEVRDNRLVDTETGSTWDSLTGRALDGPLKGKRLEQFPASVSYADDWRRFYPNSAAWTASGGKSSRHSVPGAPQR